MKIKTLFPRKKLSESLSPGNQIIYPAENGTALVCEVTSIANESVLVSMAGKQFFIPKASIDSHGIVVPKEKTRNFITERIEDPANTIVYLRHKWNQTIIDKLYNWYCRKKGRVDQTVFPK
jgi:hypothetical protein